MWYLNLLEERSENKKFRPDAKKLLRRRAYYPNRNVSV